MDKLTAETIALVLLLAAFPLTSIGSTGGPMVMTWIGLVCVVLGGALPIVTRFMDHSKDTVTDVGVEFDDRAS